MLEYLTCEVKALSEEGTFQGVVATYGNTDAQGDRLMSGSIVNLAEVRDGLPLLWSHDQAQPIGRLRLRDTPRALLGEGRLALALPKAREAYIALKEGIVNGLSIGYRTIKSYLDGEVRVLEKIWLAEASIVALPANPLARVTAVKRAYPPAGNLAALIEGKLSPAVVTGEPMLLLRQVTRELQNFRLT